MIEDPRHRIFVVKMSAQLAKITDLQSADTGIAPCCQFTVPVLADDIGMHASAVHTQMLAKLIPKSSGIQNGSGADDAVCGIARFLQRDMGQDIHRVGNDQQNAFKIPLFDLTDDGPHDLCIFLDQIQPCFLRFLIRSCCDYDDRCIRNIVIGSCIYFHRTCESHPMTDIQSLSLCPVLIRIDQHHLRKQLTLHQCKCRSRSYEAATYHCYFSTIYRH